MIGPGSLPAPGTVVDIEHVVNAPREPNALVAGKRGNDSRTSIPRPSNATTNTKAILKLKNGFLICLFTQHIAI